MTFQLLNCSLQPDSNKLWLNVAKIESGRVVAKGGEVRNFESLLRETNQAHQSLFPVKIWPANCWGEGGRGLNQRAENCLE